MMKNCLIVICLVAAGGWACAESKIKIPRRNAVEFEHGHENEVGELTYDTTGEDRAVLSIGTVDQGTLVVSDPVAIHVTQSREMNPEEWILEFGGDVVPGDNRSVVFFDGSQSFLHPTNRYAYIRTAAPNLKISGVTYDKHREQGDVSHSIEGNVATIIGHGWRQPGAEMPSSVKLIASNFVVRAYSTDRTDEVVDWTKSNLRWIDAHGEIQAGELRTWIKNTYDPITAPHWSKFIATDPVRLAGQPVLTDGAGVIRWQWLQSPAETNAAYGVLVNGFPVIKITPGSQTAAGSLDSFRIAHVEFGEFTLTFYVTAGHWGIPSLQQTSALSTDVPPAWQVVSSQTLGNDGIVDYNGELCHVIEIPTPPDAQMFYRASAPGSGGKTRLDFGNADVFLDNQPIEERLLGGVIWPTTATEYDANIVFDIQPDVSIYHATLEGNATVNISIANVDLNSGVARFETWITGDIAHGLEFVLPAGVDWIEAPDFSFGADGETIQVSWQVWEKNGNTVWQAHIYGRVP